MSGRPIKRTLRGDRLRRPGARVSNDPGLPDPVAMWPFLVVCGLLFIHYGYREVRGLHRPR